MDIEDEPVEYEYDKNGNMTKDLNRDIWEIRYNSLNLPTRIAYQDGSYDLYTYSGRGEKLKVERYQRMASALGPTSQTAETTTAMDNTDATQRNSGDSRAAAAGSMRQTVTAYCGSMVYDGGSYRLLNEEGYATFNVDGSPQFHYFLRDHLGNVRVVLADMIQSQTNTIT